MLRFSHITSAYACACEHVCNVLLKQKDSGQWTVHSAHSGFKRIQIQIQDNILQNIQQQTQSQTHVY